MYFFIYIHDNLLYEMRVPLQEAFNNIIFGCFY